MQIEQAAPGAEAYDARPWLQHYPPGVPPEIDIPHPNVWAALEQTAAEHGGRPSFVFQHYSMSFSQLLGYSRRLSDALAGAGVKKGDAVLFLLPNVPHFPVAYYACLRLGAVVTSAPPTSVEREISNMLRDSGARVVVTLDLLYDRLAGAWQDTAVERVIVGTVTDFMPWYVKVAAPYLARVPKPKTPVPYDARVRPFGAYLSRRSRRTTPAAVGPDDVALLQYTGGTTGIPKAAILTHGNLLANAQQMVSWFPQLRQGEETILAVLPFFHIYGVTLVMNAGLLLAARTVLIAGGWVPAEVFDAIRSYRPTIFPGVPTLYVALLNDERSHAFDLSSIDVCVSGGAPLPVEVKRDFEQLTGGHLYEGYGLTEASPVTHAQPYDETGAPGSIGYPLSSTLARVVDSETGEPLPVGEAGELTVSGPQVMAGYWNRPDETAQVLRNGWLFTGDIARMEPDGSFYIVDRKKDLIITGGENIYPREVEEVLFEHPKVKEAAVVGVRHPFGGEIAKAFIVLKPGEEATKREITQFAAERLAKHKVPRSVEFRESLPKSMSGKVLRRVLADEELERQTSRKHRASPQEN